MLYNRKYTELCFLTLFVILTCFFLGHNVTADNVDVASHYSLVDKINRDFWISTGYTDNLGEMLGYPPGAHYAAALINKIINSPLISMNIINIIALSIGWIVLAKIVMEAGSLGLPLMAVVIALLTSRTSLPIFGMEVNYGSFLYGQFVSTGFLIGLLYVIYQVNLNLIKKLLLSLLGYYIALKIHATVSLCYFSGSVIYFLSWSYDHRFGKITPIRNYFYIALYWVTGTFIFLTDYYTLFANSLRLHNGSLGFKYFSDGPDDIALFTYVFVSICFVVSAAIIWLSLTKKIEGHARPILILINSYLLGFCSIASLQIVMLNLNFVSPYVVKKNLFVIFTFFLTDVVVLFDVFILANLKNYKKIKFFRHVYFSPMILIVILSIFWSSSVINIPKFEMIEHAAADYSRLTQGMSANKNTVSGFSEISMPMNWLITIGPLQVYKWGALSTAVVEENPTILPENAYVLTEKRSDGISDDGILTGPFRSYTIENWRLPPKILSGQKVLLNKSNNDTMRILGKGFSHPEDWGTWSSGETAYLAFVIPQTQSKSVEVVLETNAWLTKGHESFLASVRSNGELVSEMTISNPNTFDWKFNVPVNPMLKDQQVSLQFTFTNLVSPSDLGLNRNDTRKISIGVKSLSLSFNMD